MATKVKKVSKKLLAASALLALASCTPKVNLAEYQETKIDKEVASHELPEYIVKGIKPKVAILPPENATELAKKCNLSEAALDSMMQVLGSIGSLELVERGRLNKIMEELKFQAGVTGQVDYEKFKQIAKDIDYLFIGTISSTGTRARFTEARRWTDSKGNVYYSPPSCSEQGVVSLSFRVISFPEGRIIKTYMMKGQKTISREVRSPSQCYVQDPCGLLGEAVYRAIDNKKEDFIKDFPAYGYVYKTMTHIKDKNKRIAFITLGTNAGLKPGHKVDIVEFRKETDPVKGTETLTPYTIAECTVVETELKPDKSICLVEGEQAQKVRVKHAVKTKPNVGFFRMLQKGWRAIF